MYHHVPQILTNSTNLLGTNHPTSRCHTARCWGLPAPPAVGATPSTRVPWVTQCPVPRAVRWCDFGTDWSTKTWTNISIWPKSMIWEREASAKYTKHPWNMSIYVYCMASYSFHLLSSFRRIGPQPHISVQPLKFRSWMSILDFLALGWIMMDLQRFTVHVSWAASRTIINAKTKPSAPFRHWVRVDHEVLLLLLTQRLPLRSSSSLDSSDKITYHKILLCDLCVYNNLVISSLGFGWFWRMFLFAHGLGPRAYPVLEIYLAFVA